MKKLTVVLVAMVLFSNAFAQNKEQQCLIDVATIQSNIIQKCELAVTDGVVTGDEMKEINELVVRFEKASKHLDAECELIPEIETLKKWSAHKLYTYDDRTNEVAYAMLKLTGKEKMPVVQSQFQWEHAKWTGILILFAILFALKAAIKLSSPYSL